MAIRLQRWACSGMTALSSGTSQRRTLSPTERERLGGPRTVCLLMRRAMGAYAPQYPIVNSNDSLLQSKCGPAYCMKDGLLGATTTIPEFSDSDALRWSASQGFEPTFKLTSPTAGVVMGSREALASTRPFTPSTLSSSLQVNGENIIIISF